MKRCDEAKLELLLGDKDREARRYQIYAGKKKRIKSSFPHPPRFFLLLLFSWGSFVDLGERIRQPWVLLWDLGELQVQKLASFLLLFGLRACFWRIYVLPTACRFCWIDVSDCAGRTFHCYFCKKKKNHLY